MLSKQAFNALLKTLEEPPEYLKFIFATTKLKKFQLLLYLDVKDLIYLELSHQNYLSLLKRLRIKKRERFQMKR